MQGVTWGGTRLGNAFVHGFLLALGLILPIGVQNGFVITQGSVHQRFSNVLPTIITASLCDTLLIAVSIFGVTTLSFTSPIVRLVMGVVGCGFLLFMGWSTFRSDAGSDDNPGQTSDSRVNGEDEGTLDPSGRAWSRKRQIWTAASTSLLNPHAWMDTLAIIGGSAVLYTNWRLRFSFGVACVLVSWLWFFALALTGHLAGTRLLRGQAKVWLNRGSAVMMWGSAIYLAVVLWHLG
ncbi:hypothetical protein AN477_05585 [Alicyclobacillus ferrooxydans]|uniref:Lysine transporter LysE n=1 Tax=Alicyclobacillus ferrooxydans TaxID=471514 RepID=A0A0P9EMZ3_9BACL|nr:hypothetical protein AN477_05585 [Alicyclobacillus ferrooxydans]